MNTASKYLLAMAALLHLSTPGYGQPSAKPSSYDQILKFALSSKPYDAAARATLAHLFASYCRDVLAAVPTNTPAEDAWISQEGNTTDANKISRLLQTAEWSRHQLKDTFSTCVTRASELMVIQSKKELDSEAAAFVSLAANFNEDTDLRSYARRLGMKSIADQFGLLPTLRRVLMIAALRTLEGT
ncbi:MAG: hypothetical protein HY852_00365 [Bradyrhizobium sp.]|uniref:hypothetical protein n=1 Tax=Bradyrhizobium sp. TaxID=376 RepID=UPI0025BD5A6A|nr:hypothetical protein [Bradyrhizobium sp.]MBI5260254.1 hypothetical protein [Bradyrhizobium sp.]